MSTPTDAHRHYVLAGIMMLTLVLAGVSVLVNELVADTPYLRIQRTRPHWRLPKHTVRMLLAVADVDGALPEPSDKRWVGIRRVAKADFWRPYYPDLTEDERIDVLRAASGFPRLSEYRQLTATDSLAVHWLTDLIKGAMDEKECFHEEYCGETHEGECPWCLLDDL